MIKWGNKLWKLKIKWALIFITFTDNPLNRMHSNVRLPVKNLLILSTSSILTLNDSHYRSTCTRLRYIEYFYWLSTKGLLIWSFEITDAQYNWTNSGIKYIQEINNPHNNVTDDQYPLTSRYINSYWESIMLLLICH